MDEPGHRLNLIDKLCVRETRDRVCCVANDEHRVGEGGVKSGMQVRFSRSV